MRATCHLPRHPLVALGLACSAHFLPLLCAVWPSQEGTLRERKIPKMHSLPESGDACGGNSSPRPSS